MRNIHLHISYLLLLLLIGCKQEDALTPEAPVPNPFYPEDSETDIYSQLCRDFYTETNCYLLLSDTLKHEPNGTDIYGNPIYTTELLDLTYDVTSSVQWKFDFNYATDYEREKKACEILKDYILPAIDEQFHPYSFLLVESFRYYAYQIEDGEIVGRWTGPFDGDYYIGSRAMAISVSRLLRDKEGLRGEIIRTIINKELTTTMLKEFYSFGLEYYGREIEGKFTSEEDAIAQTGIINVTDMGDGIYEMGGQQDDLKRFLNAVLDQDETDFKTLYAEYDIVLKKYDILKQLLADLNFIIE